MYSDIFLSTTCESHVCKGEAERDHVLVGKTMGQPEETVSSNSCLSYNFYFQLEELHEQKKVTRANILQTYYFGVSWKKMLLHLICPFLTWARGEGLRRWRWRRWCRRSRRWRRRASGGGSSSSRSSRTRSRRSSWCSQSGRECQLLPGVESDFLAVGTEKVKAKEVQSYAQSAQTVKVSN